MVSAISQALTEWEHDDDISAVVLSGEGERGLCAGGDIVDVVYKSALGDQLRNLATLIATEA
jgi:enoyl-CoA hydratase